LAVQTAQRREAMLVAMGTLRLRATSAHASFAASLLVVGVLLLAAPHGTDFAAHVYQRSLFLRHGLLLWNNHWYAGRYSFVGYSLLYYPLAAPLGIVPLAIVSVLGAVAAHWALLAREWGARARPAAVTFALVWPAVAITGAFPFLLGFALALGALLALQRQRRAMFVPLVLLCLLASPLAFAFLVLVCVAVAVVHRRDGRRLLAPALALAAAGALELLMTRLFPGGGAFSFPPWTLAGTLLFAAAGAALTWRSSVLLRALFLVYGCICLTAYVIPSELGANMARVRFAALPLMMLVLSLRRFRPRLVAVAVLALAAVWNLAPLESGLARAAQDPSGSAADWSPAVSYLKPHLTPSYRVEAVATSNHWEALYLPRAGIPIARGWFRQNDFPQNAILYGNLTVRGYRGWLNRLGVRYVVLSDAPLDYSARREAALLRSGRSGLQIVYRFPHGTIYRVPAPRPLISGSGYASVVALADRTVRLGVGAAGRYRVALNYSAYWSSSRGCLTRRADGLTQLTVTRPGPVELTFSPSVDGALTMLGLDGGSCPASLRAARGQ
jgi:hypothetical protein